MSKFREMDILADAASPQSIPSEAVSSGCRSVAFIYNDPVIFHEYAIDVAQARHGLVVKTVAVTAGYVCAEPRAEFYRGLNPMDGGTFGTRRAPAFFRLSSGFQNA